MDEIHIEGLTIETLIGVYDWEQTTPQTLIVDLVLFCDSSKAAMSDALDDALDYALVATGVIDLVKNEQVQLLESLAERIAGWVLQQPLCLGVEVQIHKPAAISEAADTRIKIRR